MALRIFTTSLLKISDYRHLVGTAVSGFRGGSNPEQARNASVLPTTMTARFEAGKELLPRTSGWEPIWSDGTLAARVCTA